MVNQEENRLLLQNEPQHFRKVIRLGTKNAGFIYVERAEEDLGIIVRVFDALSSVTLPPTEPRQPMD